MTDPRSKPVADGDAPRGNVRCPTPRVAALVGPYLSGKTSLLESLLSVAGTIPRKGSVRDGTTVGDASPEARARHMSVEIGVVQATFLGEPWHFLDCPGSVELSAEAANALMVADVAVVVCEPSLDKIVALGPLFRFLADNAVPHMIFVNKIELLNGSPVRVRDLLQALQAISSRRLVLREVPIREGDTVTGYVDLVSERARLYAPQQPSRLVALPDQVQPRLAEARRDLLEVLADFDDALLEQILEDVAPAADMVYADLARDFAADRIVPVFLGSAENDHGVRRLFKALRHEAPDHRRTAARLGLPGGGPGGGPGSGTVVQVFRTCHVPHAGKLSLSRVWRGSAAEGMTLGG